MNKDFHIFILFKGLPWWLSGNKSACKAGATGDVGLIPGSGRAPGGGHGNPFPWTKEPGGLQTIGTQRVGHN